MFSVPANGAASNRFDLICKSPTETVRYRVDLVRREWCWEECDGTIKIASVTSTRITFMKDDTPSSDAYAYVDRVTGEWFQYASASYGTVSNHGTCKRAPFTGFGEEKRKF
jgi:hypothetical protein